MKLSTRLYTAFALLVLLLIGIATGASIQLSALNTATRQIAGNSLPSVRTVNQMDSQVRTLRMTVMSHVQETAAGEMANIEKRLAEDRQKLAQIRAYYEKLIDSDDERAVYEKFAQQRKAVLEVDDRVLELSRAQQNEQARALLDGDSRKLFEASMETLETLVKINSDSAEAARKTAEDAFTAGRATLLGIAVLAIALAVAAALWLVRSITAPLGQAVRLAEDVANGDLTTPVAVKSMDETGQLLTALQRMQQSLASTVTRVRENSENVSTASSEIAQGNSDLSARTEQQASALEETAASMEELNSTVRQNADNARQANQLAVTASTVAVHGGEVVSEVVHTMKGINDSSKKIADIIGVIDGIAFQTNILALNAAVEAARAGEQGRGFAVVATEVRSLAQRSAEAAKEIKGLIDDSVTRVGQGTALVDQAGTTMTEVVNSIKRVADLMGEISAASEEQSQGVAQVGEAVTQMDQVTQQNAALVEEMAAAASSLNNQAADLVSAVAFFKVSGAHAAGAARSRPGVAPTRPAAATARRMSTPAPVVKPKPLARVAHTAPARGAPAPAAASDESDPNWESF